MKATYWVRQLDGTFWEMEPETRTVLRKAIKRNKDPSAELPINQIPSMIDIKTHCQRFKIEHGGEIWLRKGLVPADVGLVREISWQTRRKQIQAYLDGLADGQTILAIANSRGERPSHFYNAVARAPEGEKEEIKRLLAEARVAFSHFCKDLQLLIAEKATAKNFMAATLHCNVLAQQSKAHHRDYYGDKVTHQGDEQKPINFVIVTGVPQPERLAPPKQDLPDILIDQEDEATEPTLKYAEGKNGRSPI